MKICKPRGPRTLVKGLGVVTPSLVEKGAEVAGTVCEIVFVQKKIPLWPLLRPELTGGVLIPFHKVEVASQDRELGWVSGDGATQNFNHLFLHIQLVLFGG